MAVIDTTTLRNTVIADGRGDLFGLYEIIWGLNAQYPAAGQSEKLAAATAVVTQLLQEGVISIYRVTWHPRLDLPMPHDQAVAIVADPRSWTPPEKQGAGLYYGYLSNEIDARDSV